MSRDHERFPEDENRDILWNMAQRGDNPGKEREMDFPVIFPTQEAALNSAIHLLRNGQKVSFSPYGAGGDMPWPVHAHPVVVPTHANVSRYGALLAADAEAFGGRNDGWGCYAQD